MDCKAVQGGKRSGQFKGLRQRWIIIAFGAPVLCLLQHQLGHMDWRCITGMTMKTNASETTAVAMFMSRAEAGRGGESAAGRQRLRFCVAANIANGSHVPAYLPSK